MQIVCSPILFSFAHFSLQHFSMRQCTRKNAQMYCAAWGVRVCRHAGPLYWRCSDSMHVWRARVTRHRSVERRGHLTLWHEWQWTKQWLQFTQQHRPRQEHRSCTHSWVPCICARFDASTFSAVRFPVCIIPVREMEERETRKPTEKKKIKHEKSETNKSRKATMRGSPSLPFSDERSRYFPYSFIYFFSHTSPAYNSAHTQCTE